MSEGIPLPHQDDDRVVTADELAHYIDASPRTVRDLAARGIIARAERGKYALISSVRAVCEHLREIAAGRAAFVPGELDLVAERARLASEQADAAAMKNDVTRRSVVLVADAARAFGEQCARVRTRLLAVPSEQAPRLHRCSSAAETQAMLADAIHEALADLSSDEGEDTRTGPPAVEPPRRQPSRAGPRRR